ncbi:MAG: FAD:protein FMN transferase [Sandaracinaceae bacterium]|nr:FAD:protein FMN transferase [Sandaracinaceae bacterium]
MRPLICGLLALALVGCSEDGEDHLQPVELVDPLPSEPAHRPEPLPPPPNEDPLVRRERSIMGTVFQVTTYGMDEERAGPLLERALDEIERLEDVLSEWRDTSEISRINAAAGGEPVTVGPDTLAVVRAGLEVSRVSDGAFDLSWAALRGLYTFQAGEERVPPIEDVRARLAFVDWHQIQVEGSTVRLGRAGMAIGTGGIGKGYALDRAGDVLREGGAESYMLFGGGQVQVHGLRGDRPWRVGIQHPRDPASYIGFLEATDGSISTSGDYEHAFRDAEGQHWHHIIDLGTGLPARRSMQVTLLAERGLYADAFSTAAFVLGPEAALEMIANAPFPMEAVIIGPDLRVHMTPGTREHLVMRVELDENGRLPGETEFQGWRRPASPIAESGGAH